MTTEISKENKQTNPLSNIKNNFTGASFPNGLAIILIIGSIASILVLVGIHMSTVDKNQELYKDVFTQAMSSNSNPKPTIEQIFNTFQNYYRETNASNSNLLSILLPVIGTWIGAILAFYYGNKNLERLSEGYNNAVKTIQGSTNNQILKNTKVKEVLDTFTDYKKVNMAKISELVGIKMKELGRFSTILITDDNSKPLGFLSLDDITSSTQLTKENILSEQRSFKKLFDEMTASNQSIKDTITETYWSDNGVHNYAEINLEDTLEQAQNKMKNISQKQSVRGLVLDNNKKIQGLVTMDLFSKVLVEF